MKKIIDKIKLLINDEQIQFKLLFLFLVLQPVLDCSFLYSEKVISFFHFSPTTIIRLLFVAFLALIIFLRDKEKKNKIILIVYGVLIGLYTVVHHIYSSNLIINNYDGFAYTLSTELLYILRMLLPIGMIYISYKSKYTKENFIRIIFTVLTIMSAVIVGSNLLGISLASYGGGQIEGNIFSWFFEYGKYSSSSLASKGWFNSANQISGLFMFLSPIAIYSLFDDFSYKKLGCVCLTILSMIMLGTRVASFGWVLVIFLIMAIDIFMIVIHKHKFRKKSYVSCLLILAIGLVITQFAPVVSAQMSETYNEMDSSAAADIEELIELEKLIATGTLEEEEIERLLKDKECFNEERKLDSICLVNLLSINPVFYKEIYPVEKHLDFWEKFMFEIPQEQKNGQRNIQLLISTDINEKQKTKTTPILGYGYSRYINTSLYLEHDFFVHYYTIGIVGIVLLLCPYLIIAIMSIIYLLKKKSFNFLNLLLCAIILEVLAISYVTGHIMDELIVSLFIGFVTGFLLKRMKEIDIK